MGVIASLLFTIWGGPLVCPRPPLPQLPLPNFPVSLRPGVVVGSSPAFFHCILWCVFTCVVVLVCGKKPHGGGGGVCLSVCTYVCMDEPKKENISLPSFCALKYYNFNLHSP